MECEVHFLRTGASYADGELGRLWTPSSLGCGKALHYAMLLKQDLAPSMRRFGKCYQALHLNYFELNFILELDVARCVTILFGIALGVLFTLPFPVF